MPPDRDAPRYRVWPPLALGAPLAIGLLLDASRPTPVPLSDPWRIGAGFALLAAFGAINSAALVAMARARTGLLPGQTTHVLLMRGPFAWSRNPLYVGLVLLALALALLMDSAWALALLPIGVVALLWGAILPEERYLSAKFGAEYLAYRRRVRRWI